MNIGCHPATTATWALPPEMTPTVAHQASPDLNETDTKNNVAVSTKQRLLNPPQSETIHTNQPTRGIIASTMHPPRNTSTHPLAQHRATMYLSKIVPTTSHRQGTTATMSLVDRRRRCTTMTMGSRSTSSCV